MKRIPLLSAVAFALLAQLGKAEAGPVFRGGTGTSTKFTCGAAILEGAGEAPSLYIPYHSGLSASSRILSDARAGVTVSLKADETGAYSPVAEFFSPSKTAKKPAYVQLPALSENVRAKRIAVSPDGTKIFAYAPELHQAIAITDANSGEELSRVVTDGMQEVVASNTHLALIAKTHVSLYDLNTGKEIRRLHSDGSAGSYLPTGRPAFFHKDGANARFTADGSKLVVTAHENGQIILNVVETETGSIGEDKIVQGNLMAIDPSGTIAIIKSANSRAILLNIDTGAMKSMNDNEINGGLQAADISSNGKLLAAHYSLGRVLIFELKSGNIVRSLNANGDQLADLRFSPDSKKVLGIGESFHAWDLN